MKLILTLIILINLVVYGQVKEKNYDSFLFFNEFFVSVNQSIVKDYYISGYGKSGFDFGLKHIFHPQKQIHFVYGLEFNYTQFYMNYHYQFNSHSGSFNNCLVTNLYISNSFAYRFHLGEKKLFFIESGTFIDFAVGGHIKGTYNPYDGPSQQVNNRFVGANLLGVCFGVGTIFVFKNFEFSLKPDVKVKLLQIQSDKYIRNIAYARLLLSIRKVTQN